MGILIKNLRNNECLTYPLPLLIGEVISSAACSEISIKNATEGTSFATWPLCKNKFKVLVQLCPGKNNVFIECGTHKCNILLTYLPNANSKLIRLVYIKCKDDTGDFQAPKDEDNSLSSAVARISLGAQMIQTFTAEKFLEHGLERRTFCLEEDETGRPLCHVFTSCLTIDQVHQMQSGDLWAHFACELMGSALRNNSCKFLAFVSFTRFCNPTLTIPKNFDEILKLTKGYVALGGGGLALFGTACIHTWPQNLAEVPKRLADNRFIDKRYFMDDSGNRGCHWACYSTGLGATLHELGHTFDLGHTGDGIMGRGFDDMYKFFTVDSGNKILPSSPLERNSHQPTKESISNWDVDVIAPLFFVQEVKEEKEKPMNLPVNATTQLSTCKNLSNGGAHWCRSSALILYYHRWLNPTSVQQCQKSLQIKGLTITSPYGIRVIEFRDLDGMSLYHLEYLNEEGPSKVTLSAADIRHKLSSHIDQIILVAEDSCGQLLKTEIILKNFR